MSQEANTDSLISPKPFIQKVSLFVLPIVYYTPETRLAGGAGLLYTFRFRNEPIGALSSFIQPGFAYTQENQLLLYLPFRLYKDNERFITYGELGYYRYSYFFYGIGNQAQEMNEELFDITYPRLRLHQLIEVVPNYYLGAMYAFDEYQVSGKLQGGILDDPGLSISGRNGGRVATAGLITLLDTRDNQFFPRKGVFGEGTFQLSRSFLFSDYRFLRATINVSGYLSLGKTDKHVLAANLYNEWIEGTAPFNALALLGGVKRMRGYYEGRYRDNNLLATQIEYRGPLFWRFRWATFFSYGGVAPSIRSFKLANMRYTYGAGLRFLISKEEQVYLRADLGLGKNTSGFYFTIGEAF